MYLVLIAWVYVVLLMAVAEATGSDGSLLGAALTILFYGALPLAIVMYLLGTPGRRHARRRAVDAGRNSAPNEASEPVSGDR